MATPLADRNRKNEVAESLVTLGSQAQGAIAQLSQIKGHLLALKKAVNAEVVFGAEEEAEVQEVIVGLAAQIQALLGG